VRSGLAVFACDGLTQSIRVVLVDAIHGSEEGDHQFGAMLLELRD
jgi:phage baseplate assembly protein W